MKRTRKLLAAFLSPAVSGVVIGVCGANGCNRSTENAPTSEHNAVEVNEKKANTDKQNFGKGIVEKATKEILAVLPTQPISRSKWVTKDDLAKKLPNIELELLDEALGLLKEDRKIDVFKDDSGTLSYAKSYSDEAVEDASNLILDVLNDQSPVERSKWATKADLAKELDDIEPELLDEALDCLKEDDKVVIFKDDSKLERYGERYTSQG